MFQSLAQTSTDFVSNSDQCCTAEIVGVLAVGLSAHGLRVVDESQNHLVNLSFFFLLPLQYSSLKHHHQFHLAKSSHRPALMFNTVDHCMCRSVFGSADSVSDMLCEMMTSDDVGWVDILAGFGIIVASDTGQVQLEHCSV